MLDGLGKFYPTLKSKGATEAEMMEDGWQLQSLIKGVRLRFLPTSKQMQNITSRQYMTRCSVEGANLIRAVRDPQQLKAGDVLEVRKGPALMTYKVLKVAENRMGASLVPEYAEDLTPEHERAKLHAPHETIVLQRDRGAGRPTKRDRRQLEEMLDSMDY